MYSVQMIKDHYDIINNPKVKTRYPVLHEEVITQDKASHSSWYSLSAKAFSEYKLYVDDRDIGYFS
jgi:hypothetical protein